jgi:hypothetical protein
MAGNQRDVDDRADVHLMQGLFFFALALPVSAAFLVRRIPD